MTKRLSALLRLALASLCIIFLVTDASAYLLKNDGGGKLKVYEKNFLALQKTNEPVIIDEDCFSACALVVLYIPRNRICVMNKARLGFHAARDPDTNAFSKVATDRMYNALPQDFKIWVSENHAFESLELTYLQGPTLEAMIKPCTPAQASPKTSQTTGQGQSASR